MKLEYKVTNNNYETINQVLKNELKLSARLLSKLILNKKIFLNDIVVDTRSKIEINDVITIQLDLEETSENIIPTQMDLDIVFEDDAMLVINKTPGMPVHPSQDHYTDSVSNGVKYYFDSIHLKKKIRPVNRLDRDTSGLVIFAKNEYVQEYLIKQMQNNSFHKEYIAICDGIFEPPKGVIDLPIDRKENSIIERCISEAGKKATTQYEVITQCSNYAIIKCILKTGRTHQIRVHMQAINHPLLSDTLYGNTSNLIQRQALHCYKMKFINPITQKEQIIIAPLPNDFNFIKKEVNL